MSASHLPQDDSISLRDMEAGGSTLESGSSGFSVSDGFAVNIAKLPELDAVPSRESGTEIERARAYACWVALAEKAQSLPVRHPQTVPPQKHRMGDEGKAAGYVAMTGGFAV
jgi:hypothetical protein